MIRCWLCPEDSGERGRNVAYRELGIELARPSIPLRHVTPLLDLYPVAVPPLLPRILERLHARSPRALLLHVALVRLRADNVPHPQLQLLYTARSKLVLLLRRQMAWKEHGVKKAAGAYLSSLSPDLGIRCLAMLLRISLPPPAQHISNPELQ